MKIRHNFGIIFFSILMLLGISQQALASEDSENIAIADQKVILEQYEEAKEIYQDIIASSEPSVIVAYAHYKLGSLYKRQNDQGKAKQEYKKGLVTLKDSGQSNHQIAKHLSSALTNFDW